MSKAVKNKVKLNDVVSVKDFGAKGDGVTDDTAAIQAAITANAGGVIFFPAGVYKITSTILVSANSTRLVGDERRARILNEGTGDAIKFYSTTTAQTDFLSGCGISGFYIYRSTHTVSVGAGIRMVQCQGFVLEDVYVINHPEGIRVLGGQLNNLSNFELFASSALTDISATADSALLALLEAPTDGATYQPCYTVRLSNFNISPGQKTQTSVLIGNVDGLQVTNAYINGAKTTLCRFHSQRNGSNITAVTINSVYFDCVGNNTSYAIDAPTDGFASSFIYNINLSNCYLSGCNESGIFLSKEVNNLTVSGCSLENIGKSAFDLTGSVSYGNFVISGCEINNAGSDAVSSGIIKITGGLSLTAVGNKIHGAASCGAAFDLGGTISCVTISDNTIRSATTDINNAATISKLAYTGNNSVNTSSSTSLMGVYTGNQENSNALTLDWYEEGTFTPTLTFGGASVGMTYTTQSGSFTRLGNRVLFQMLVTLSAKGSSTGNAIFPNCLPYTNAIDCAVSARITNMTSGVGDTMISALAVGTVKNVRLDKTTTGFVSILTDADFTNTSSILISGQYRV